MNSGNLLEDARAAFFDGVAHFEGNRLIEAEAAFLRALEFAPGRTSVMINLGVTRVHLGKYAEATTLLEAGVQAEPASPDAWGALAHARFELSLWEPARQAFERAFTQGTDSQNMRLQYVKCLFRTGALEAAEHAIKEILALDALCAEAWYQLGDLQRESGQTDLAVTSYRQALANGADPELVNYLLSALNAEAPVLTPPRAYVQGLFDQYADDFEQHLVGQLGYRGHRTLIELLPIDVSARLERVLDLGCGTGLCSAMLRPRASSLVGVDLSPAMIEKSRLLGRYDLLLAADVHDFLSEDSWLWDLVVAADVFIYIGELHRLFGLLERRIAPGGWLAFTVESAEQGKGVQLLPSLRYAHSLDYIFGLAQQHGFTIESVQDAPIRVHEGQPLLGRYWYLRKGLAAQ